MFNNQQHLKSIIMKSKIIGVLAIVFVLGLGGWKYYSWAHPETVSPDAPVTSSNVVGGSTSESAPTVVTHAPQFDVEVQNPINGVKLGVIEVGASGFNCFGVRVDKQDNWALEYKEFGESAAYEGFMSAEDVKAGLKKYILSLGEHGVAGRNIHFVVSSGAMKNPKTPMVVKTIKGMGYQVNTVTATEEGQYAFSALISKTYRTDSFTVDIGSGNTKVSWYENGRIKSLEGPGAKYDQIPLTKEEVTSQITALVQQVPASSRQQCFIIGGIPFKLASDSRQGEERFTLLGPPTDYNADGNDKKAAGLVIYKAIFDTSGTDKFIFDWDANFTIGFLLTLN